MSNGRTEDDRASAGHERVVVGRGGRRPGSAAAGPRSAGRRRARPPWIEFRLGDSSLMIFKLEGEPRAGGPAAHVPWVYVDDVAGHYERARAGGATIVTELGSPWGLPFYVAE